MKYRLPDDSDDVLECPIEVSHSPEYDAVLWAEWYWDRRDGWEASWPKTVELEVDGGWQAFEIEMEHVPSFSAYKVEVSHAES